MHYIKNRRNSARF